MSGAAGPLRLLFVCTANICRSPAAEYLARARYGEGEIVFRSVGVMGGHERCPEPLLRVLGERGVDISGHRSYLADRASVVAADLVLTMEGRHVADVVRLDPSALAKVAPMTELAGLLRSAGPLDGLPELLGLLERHRDARSYLSGRWDIEDPYRRRLRDYRRAVDRIDTLVDEVVGRLPWPRPGSVSAAGAR